MGADKDIAKFSCKEEGESLPVSNLKKSEDSLEVSEVNLVK